MFFPEIAMKVAISVFSEIKILENTAFGHMSEYLTLVFWNSSSKDPIKAFLVPNFPSRQNWGCWLQTWQYYFHEVLHFHKFQGAYFKYHNSF